MIDSDPNLEASVTGAGSSKVRVSTLEPRRMVATVGAITEAGCTPAGAFKRSSTVPRESRTEDMKSAYPSPLMSPRGIATDWSTLDERLEHEVGEVSRDVGYFPEI